MNSLLRQLESHLDYDQAILLRQQLYGEFRGAVGHPPGTAHATGAAQEELLTASGRLDEGLSDAQRAAEVDVVRRSQPQPSRDPGYVDEVDLGNGHTWRRRADGTWCRFTKITLCGTTIRGAADMPRGSAAQIAAVRSSIETEAARAEQISRVIENRDAMLARAQSGRPPGQRAINYEALTEDERAVLALLADDPETLTPGALRELFWDPTGRVANPLDPTGAPITRPTGAPSEARALQARAGEAVSRLQRQLHDLSSTLYTTIRARTPGREVSLRVMRRANGLDEISRARPRRPLSVEHVFAVRDIVDLPGFAQLADLDLDAARAIADFEPNLVAMDHIINSQRGNRPWSTPFSGREAYSAADIQRMIELEDAMRTRIQQEINDALARAGSAVGP